MTEKKTPELVSELAGKFSDMRQLVRFGANHYALKTAFRVKESVSADGIPEFRDITFRDFGRDTERLGTALVRRCGSGERIAIAADSSYRWVLAAMTAACGAGTVIPFDPDWDVDLMEECLIRTGAAVIFYDKAHSEKIHQILINGKTGLRGVCPLDFEDEIVEGSVSLDTLLKEGEEALAADDFTFMNTEIDTEGPSYLFYTAWSSDIPRAVMLSQKNLMCSIFGMDSVLNYKKDEVCLILLPLYHIYSFSGVLSFYSRGLTTVFGDGTENVQRNMQECHASVVLGAPYLFRRLYEKILKDLSDETIVGKYRRRVAMVRRFEHIGVNLRKQAFAFIHDRLGGNIHFLINGGGALDPKVREQFHDLGIQTLQCYELTEAAAVVSCETPWHHRKGSSGILFSNVQAKIDRPDQSGIGELLLKGDCVMLGYYGDEEASRRAFTDDGWLRTGDLARIDKNGYLYMYGRYDDRIDDRNGNWIFPEEIEALINRLPYVLNSVVFLRGSTADGNPVIWAKAVLDPEYLEEEKPDRDELIRRFDRDMHDVNNQLPKGHDVTKYFLSERPTVNTPMQMIKRPEELENIEQEIAERGLDEPENNA